MPGSLTRLLFATSLIGLSGCAASDAPRDPREIMPQDASRPTAYDTLPAVASADRWAALVTVTCRVEMDGRSSGCAVRDTIGNAAFDEPALEYARSLVFLPAFSNGAGPVEPSHVIHIAFNASTKFLPRDMRASLAVPVHLSYPPQIKDGSIGKVHLSCTVEITGDLENCRVTDVQGDQAFAEQALREVRRAHYSPAWQHGKPVAETDRHLTLVFVPPPEPFPVPLAPPAGVVFDKPTFGARLTYPDALIDRHQQGSVLVFCDLGQDGVNRNCEIGGVRGDAAFGAAALAHVSSEVVHATRADMPVAIAHRPYVVTFAEDTNVW